MGHLSSPSRSCLGRLILIRGGPGQGRGRGGPAGRVPPHPWILSLQLGQFKNTCLAFSPKFCTLLRWLSLLRLPTSSTELRQSPRLLSRPHMLHSQPQPSPTHRALLFGDLCVISSPGLHVYHADGPQEVFLSLNLLIQIISCPSLISTHHEDRIIAFA